jgi:hypothetical protein
MIGFIGTSLQLKSISTAQTLHSASRSTILSLTDLNDVCLMNELMSRVESYVTTDGKSASLSWSKAPIWGLRPDLYYCLTVAGLLIWGALSDERTDLSFTIAAGPRERSHSRVRVPWYS